MPKPPAGLGVAASDALAVQSGNEAGARLRQEACAAVTDEAKSSSSPGWARAPVDCGPAEAAPAPLALPRAQHHGPRRSPGAVAVRVLDASEPIVQAGSTPTHRIALAELDGAAGSRGIESIHVVDRSASSCAGAQSESSDHPNHMRPGRRRRFYLAVQIERSTSPLRYDISRLRNIASHVSPHAIHAHADC